MCARRDHPLSKKGVQFDLTGYKCALGAKFTKSPHVAKYPPPLKSENLVILNRYFLVCLVVDFFVFFLVFPDFAQSDMWERDDGTAQSACLLCLLAASRTLEMVSIL